MEDLLNTAERADLASEMALNGEQDSTNPQDFSGGKIEEAATDAGDNPDTKAEGEGVQKSQDGDFAGSDGIAQIVTVPIKYNHEKIDLSLSQAADLAQKGMQAQEIMGKLRFLAAANSCGVASLVDKLIKSDEECYLNDVMERTNGDTELANELLAARKAKIEGGLNQELIESRQNDTLSSRFAEEFLTLQKEIPEITGIASVPDSVIITAAEENISLFDAYLRYRFSEDKKIEAENETQRINSYASTGSQADGNDSESSPEVSAMLRGIFG